MTSATHKSKPTARFFFFIIFLIGFFVDANAQERVIHGYVKDSVTNKPLASATVSVFHETNLQNARATGLTIASGAFNVYVRDTGKYLIEISFAGYEKKVEKIHLIDSTLDVGNISMIRKASMLQGVTVTAQKKLIEQTDDKIIYNVENDPLAKGQSAIDILRRTPFISVDGNDNVRLNGQTNFRVLLNGRETAMFAQNVSDALQGFPGASIVKIEVITNPSAKYDAEGIGGIINIVTKKKIEGYNGSVSTWNTTINQHIENINFNAKMGKVGVVLNYGTRLNLNIPSNYLSTTVPGVDAFYTRRTLEGDRRSTFFSHFGNAEISWALDSLNTLSFFGNVSGGYAKTHLDLQTVTVLNNSSTTLNSSFDQSSRRQFPTNTIGTDYIKKYSGNPDKEFSIRINAELGESNAFLKSIENTSSYTRDIVNNTFATNNQYTLQSDYLHPIAPGKRLEIGARATLRIATSDFKNQFRYNIAEGYKLNPQNSDNFNFFQDVYSAYGSYSFKINTFSFRTGLRVEHTSINGNFRSNKAFAKNSYINILPNFQASTHIKNLALVLSYNQRLQRPYIFHLNPFVDNNDSLNITFGNPDLDAQTIHTVSLQSRLQKGKAFMGLTFTGSYSDNMIVTLISFNPSTGVRSSTYDNVGKDFFFTVNGNINTPLGAKAMLNAGINFQFRTLRNQRMPEQFNSGIGGNTSVGVNYTFSPKFSMNNYVGFEQAIIDLQSKPNTIPFCGSGINYQIIPNKLRMGLMAQNYFAKRYEYTTVITGPTFETEVTNINLMGKLVFSANWNFGKLKERVSRRRGVTNDDILGAQ